MKTIVIPQGSAAPIVHDWTPPSAFTPFQITCWDASCRAVLEVDNPADVVYDARYIGYGDDLTLRLMVVCPHCNECLELEVYSQPGNPTGKRPRGVGVNSDEPPKYFHCLPDAVRSRAYKLWEQSKSAVYWQEFFNFGDVASWARRHPRDARKMRARLLGADR